MRISDWSSDVCSSDLPSFSGAMSAPHAFICAKHIDICFPKNYMRHAYACHSRRGGTRALVGLRDEKSRIGRAEDLWHSVRSATSSLCLQRSSSPPSPPQMEQRCVLESSGEYGV